MVDSQIGFEVLDNAGVTRHANGSVTTIVAFPSTPTFPISEVLIDNIETNPSRVLQVSFDGGSNWKSIGAQSSLGWTFKGTATQFHLRSNSANPVAFECLVNVEPHNG